MANYLETTVSGSKWQRCRAVTINNPLGGAAEAWFQEEEVITIDAANTFTRDVSAVKVAFNPTDVIALLDTETGEPTGGTITHGALYQALYSAYIAAALARDAAAAPE